MEKVKEGLEIFVIIVNDFNFNSKSNTKRKLLGRIATIHSLLNLTKMF